MIKLNPRCRDLLGYTIRVKPHNQTDQECAQYYPVYSPCERNSQVSDAEHVITDVSIREKKSKHPQR